MQIFRLLEPSETALDAKRLWEENMHEPWADYAAADKFIVLDRDEIVGGFAVYWDDSDGISGHYCSGWAGRHKGVPCGRILQRLVESVGDVYFKTNKRTAKLLLERIGEKVKTANGFGYYIIKG